MNEQLLRTIIHLLAIVAKEDDVIEGERNAIEDFLLENLSQSESQKYLRLFDAMTNQMAGARTVSFDEKKEIELLSIEVNEELTQQQKIVIILKVLELIVADQEISQRELDILYHIGAVFKFSTEVVDLLKAFVANADPTAWDAEHVLTIDAKDGRPQAPNMCRHIQRTSLSGYMAFLRLPKPEMYFMKYVGEDALTLNGIPVRKGKNMVFVSGSALKGGRIDPIYYSDVMAAFRENDAVTNMTFIADHVAYTFPNGHMGLQDIQVAESTGCLVALMGGSGSGKSTLLNVLNGSEAPSKGSVKINGVDIHRDKKSVEGLVGYVPQDDLLIEELSVSDNLFYAAKLCFARHSDAELRALAHQTLVALGLEKASHLKVGSPMQKTISGGQRKRLNIGLELLRAPSVMFIDEPTSGLSSRDSENIMDLLKELSLKGKLIFVVIHQPSSAIFKMFDRLLILDVGGYQIYYGHPIEAITYFKTIAHLADRDTSACMTCGNVNPEQIFDIIEAKVVNECGELTRQRKVSPKEWHEHFAAQTPIKSLHTPVEKPQKTLDMPSKFKQMTTFFRRDLASKLGNKAYLTINLLEAPLLAFILAFMLRYVPEGSVSYSFEENPNLPAFFFMAVIIALFVGLTVSAEEIFRDRKILKRESFLHLSRFSYLMSKVILLFTLSAVQSLLFVWVGSVILGIQGMGMTFWLVMFSLSCFANVLGLNISSAFDSAVTIYILIPLLLIPQLLLSGVVVSFDKLSPWFSHSNRVPIVGEMMASKWGYEALAVAQFKDNAFKKNVFDYDQNIAQSEFKSTYYFPLIEQRLNEAKAYVDTEHPEEQALAAQKLRLIQNELRKEMEQSQVPADKFTAWADLTLDQFSDSTYEATKKFLQIMRKVYNYELKEALSARQAWVSTMTRTEAQAKAFEKLRRENVNQAMTFLVKNNLTKNRLLETSEALIQKIYPIYLLPAPTHDWDIRAHFYASKKHFLARYYDTPYFNIVIIWLMSLLLFIVLYFHGLRRLVTAGGFSWRRFMKM